MSHSTDEQTLLDLYAEQCRAMIDARTDVLDRILDDDFTAQHVTGHLATKQEWLAQIDSGEFAYRGIDVESTQVSVEGDRAVVTSHAFYTVVLGGHHGRYRLDTSLHYHRQGASWRAVNGDSTLA